MNKIDISALSAEELQAELERRKVAARQAEDKKRKVYEDDKELFIAQTIQQFNYLSKHLKDLKQHAIAEANKLYERMFEINSQPAKDVKSFTLKNASDTMKVVVDRQERFEFTDEAVVHIDVIKAIFREKFAQRNRGLYNLLDSLLIRNAKNDYDPKLLTKARTQVNALGDAQLIDSFDKLMGCQRVTGSALYCRAYVRDEEGKRWRDISLNFSSL